MSALARPARLLFGLLVLAACDSAEPTDPGMPPQVCEVVAPTECPDPAPRYADVAPIFEQRCASCHNDVAGSPWPLDTYDHVADWAPFVRDELVRCSMPPPDSGVTITPEERDLILVWIRCGYPE
jgi:uncharacterized membrane protein